MIFAPLKNGQPPVESVKSWPTARGTDSNGLLTTVSKFPSHTWPKIWRTHFSVMSAIANFRWLRCKQRRLNSSFLQLARPDVATRNFSGVLQIEGCATSRFPWAVQWRILITLGLISPVTATHRWTAHQPVPNFLVRQTIPLPVSTAGTDNWRCIRSCFERKDWKVKRLGCTLDRAVAAGDEWLWISQKCNDLKETCNQEVWWKTKFCRGKNEHTYPSLTGDISRLEPWPISDHSGLTACRYAPAPVRPCGGFTGTFLLVEYTAVITREWKIAMWNSLAGCT